MIDIEQEIIKTIAEEGKIDTADLGPEKSFYDLGVDSLSVLEILASLEKKYDIMISDAELKNVGSVGEIVKIISYKIKEKE